MVKPTLVIMAAGMGSRYGGLKQMDPMDEHGNVLMDFSVFDALRAGYAAGGLRGSRRQKEALGNVARNPVQPRRGKGAVCSPQRG